MDWDADERIMKWDCFLKQVENVQFAKQMFVYPNK